MGAKILPAPPNLGLLHFGVRNGCQILLNLFLVSISTII